MQILLGHIYLVNFDPSIGKEYQKIRPALVIQSNEITAWSELVTVIPISSRVERRETDEIIIYKDSQNRLMNDSILKVRQISSFDKKRFIHHIGFVSDVTLNSVASYLRKHFSL